MALQSRPVANPVSVTRSIYGSTSLSSSGLPQPILSRNVGSINGSSIQLYTPPPAISGAPSPIINAPVTRLPSNSSFSSGGGIVTRSNGPTAILSHAVTGLFR